MEVVWLQIIGGAIASIIGGIIGFCSAFFIQKVGREDQLRDFKKNRLMDAFSRLHKIYSNLYHYAFFERELSDEQYQSSHFALTVLDIEHPKLARKHYERFSNALKQAARDEFKDLNEQEQVFREFDSVLVDLLNDIEITLKSSDWQN
jgi:hypothetical protein